MPVLTGMLANMVYVLTGLLSTVGSTASDCITQDCYLLWIALSVLTGMLSYVDNSKSVSTGLPSTEDSTASDSRTAVYCR